MALASEKKILVVDDEPDVRNFLVACIEDAGFQVDTAADGEEALQKVAAEQPDLMTLDMVMPRKSGIQVIRKLRENEKYRNLPVIVITAHAHDELASEDIKGFSAFVSGLRPRYTMEKPVSPPKLVNAICEILGVEQDENRIEKASERNAIMELLRQSDEATLNKIREMLNNK